MEVLIQLPFYDEFHGFPFVDLKEWVEQDRNGFDIVVLGLGLVLAAIVVLAPEKLDGAEENVGVVKDWKDHVKPSNFENVVGDFAVAEVLSNVFNVFYFLVDPEEENDANDYA